VKYAIPDMWILNLDAIQTDLKMVNLMSVVKAIKYGIVVGVSVDMEKFHDLLGWWNYRSG